jgi:hypothetical protein
VTEHEERLAEPERADQDAPDETPEGGPPGAGKHEAEEAHPVEEVPEWR